MCRQSFGVSDVSSNHELFVMSTVELDSSATTMSTPQTTSYTSRTNRKRKATANIWADAREPQDPEPVRCARKEKRIYYYKHCINPVDGIELEASDHPIEKQRDNTIKDSFAKAGEVNAMKQSAKRRRILLLVSSDLTPLFKDNLFRKSSSRLGYRRRC